MFMEEIRDGVWDRKHEWGIDYVLRIATYTPKYVWVI
jgi:hypothetical protein